MELLPGLFLHDLIIFLSNAYFSFDFYHLGGANVPVTSSNKHRYINSVAKYYLHDRIKVPSRAFFRYYYD